MIEDDDLKIGEEIAAISKNIDTILDAVAQARAELKPQTNPDPDPPDTGDSAPAQADDTPSAASTQDPPHA